MYGNEAISSGSSFAVGHNQIFIFELDVFAPKIENLTATHAGV